MNEPPVPVLLNLLDYEEAARAVLPAGNFGYVAGGGGDEITLRQNRAAFERWQLLPRMLTGHEIADLTTTVLGQPVAFPVLLAPAASHKLMHPRGELATAAGARRAGTIYCLSSAASYPIEEVAAQAGTWWFQLYYLRDRALNREIIQRAEAAGASAIVLTADTPAIGLRERDARNGFVFPVDAAPVGPRQPPRPPSAGGEQGQAYAGAGYPTSWADCAWLAGVTRLPVLVKGILAPADARLALEHGARGIIVSNHGGRQADTTIAALDALPAIVEAVNGRCEVLMDGGVRRGTDVLKALALGARAVAIGRPFLWGLAVDGADGVYRVLELLASEIATNLLICGLGSVQEITRSLLLPPGPLLSEPAW